MALPTSFYGEQIADNTLKANGQPESADWQVPIQTVTAANLNATIIAVADLSTALLNLGIGNILTQSLTQRRQLIGTGPASSDLAQRENKWLFRYHDNTTHEKFRMSYPCADLSQHMPNSEFVDLSSGNGADAKAKFEAIVVSPADAAHSVTLDSIQFVGRNT